MMTRPGEVYRVDLGLAGKVRPMLVLSRQDEDAPRALSVCAPITTSYRESGYEIRLPRLPFLREQSYVNLQAIQAVQQHELSRHPIGRIPSDALERVRHGLCFVFEIDQ